MINLLAQRHFVRRNVLAFIGFSLCLYFSWHLLAGQRSYLRLMALEQQVAAAETDLGLLTVRREAIETRVVRLRPDTLDRDFLDERVRYVLGYRAPDDRLLVDLP
ncbi:MAG: septum formation initiator family protein [Alphaproteobacteria bacterium]|nr:septum formation initiator family protein [Alphaproteobacteria bacterium]